jgi:isopentenyl diphosphate isomerase/L-lactate dehydrogenase-like FMN-dependent dehydrogenase
MRENVMISVKTFTTEIKPFYTMRELEGLDEQVNRFLADKGIKTVLSVSDACTTDDSGATIGLIRVVAYEG